MKIKADYDTLLHWHRRRQLEAIFSKCPENLFSSALELGAGDGFQSKLLGRYVSRLIATDYNPAILELDANEAVEYRVCDAEIVDEAFKGEQFDLVFSSNLLEHVEDPQKVLKGICKVLKEDGITIHIMPNRFWKVLHLVLYIPNRIVSFLERSSNPTWRKQKLRWLLGSQRAEGGGLPSPDRGAGEMLGRNPKTKRRSRSFICRLFLPEPHGVSSTNLAELSRFSKVRWKREFERAGLELVAVKKGKVLSAYAFGCDRIRRMLESMGLSTEYVYVARMKGKTSRYCQYF